MSSSQQPESSARRRDRQDDSGQLRVAPYLTHVVAHHGQLTLIPPQNAGRIRKPTKKKKQPAARDRLDDEEPRFTTAVPPSSSRKLQTSSAHVRTRKHAISSPTAPTASSSRRYDAIVDDQSIPDYPPPSFEDAIASPHVPPLLSSVPPSPFHQPATQSHDAPESPIQPDSELPMTPSVSDESPAASTSFSPSVLYHSPAASQSSLVRSVDPSFPHPRSLHPPAPAPSRLAIDSTTSLPSSASVVSHSTALSDTPLLRPPQPRSVPHSSSIQPASPPRERSPNGVPYRLTSPSTTTLLSPAHALRDSPTVSHPAVASQLSLSRSAEPPSPSADLSTPSSPNLDSRTSIATASDVFEEFTWEPRQRWSADRRLGLSLEERVQREFERRNTEEVLTALGGSPASAPVEPPVRRCPDCGSRRLLECADSIDEESFVEDDFDDDGDSGSSPIPHAEKGKSPYMHSMAAFLSRSQTRLFKSQNPEPASPPSSPLSPNTSSSFFKNPSAWASNVTLSLTNALGSNGHAAEKSPNTKPLKRRESFGVKRLFGSLKGKERERDPTRTQSMSHIGLSTTVKLDASFISSSDSSSASESVDGWEVVSNHEADSRHWSPSNNSSTSSTAPTSPARSDASATSPTSPTDGARQAFLNRPVRHRPAPLDSPTTPTSPALPPLRPVPVVSTPVVSTSPASARPYLPEKSPLRALGNSPQLRQARIQTHTTAVNASQVNLAAPTTPLTPSPATPTSPSGHHNPAPGTPRSVRPSPSVVWMAPSPQSRSPLSRTPASGSPVRPSPLATPTQHVPMFSAPPPPVAPHLIHPVHPTHSQPPTQMQMHNALMSHAINPVVAALSRSEKTALRHHSAPLPTMAMTMTMSVPHEPAPVPLSAPVPMPANANVHPLMRQADPREHSPPSPLASVHTHLRRRRAATPPPSSHRRAIVQYDTSDSDEQPVLSHLGAPGASPSSSPSLSRSSSRASSPCAGQLVGRQQPLDMSCPDVEEVVEPESPVVEQPEDTGEGAGEVEAAAAADVGNSDSGKAVTRVASVRVSPVSTPTTPTFPPTSLAGTPYHYRGRPLPQVPGEREAEVPVKRVPDGFAVNRLPEACDEDDVPPPPFTSSAESSTPQVPTIVEDTSDDTTPVPTLVAASPASVLASVPPPPSPPSPPTVVSPPPPPPAVSVPTPRLTALVLPERMERSSSGGSVLEEARQSGPPLAEFLQVTDLDVLASRALEGAQDGRNYEDLLLVQEVVGPAPSAAPTTTTTPSHRSAAEKHTVPYTGKVEVSRRRVLKDGRVKVKMSLMGVPVDRCGVCLSQFRKDEQGALTPVCKHSFHEVCLRRWLGTARVCPICRMALSMDD